MLLDGLMNGSIVNLEMVTEDNCRYEVSSVVSGASKNSLLIEPLDVRGMSANEPAMDEKADGNVIYNIYADDSNGNRVGWYNVTVKSIDYKDKSYKGIWTRCFNQDSVQADRRINDRMKLKDMTGTVETADGVSYEVSLYDVSNNGIAFLADDDSLLHKSLVVHIDDLINGEIYRINVNCTCVRCAREDGKILVGCSIGEADRAYLLYLYEKKLSYRMPMAMTCSNTNANADATAKDIAIA